MLGDVSGQPTWAAFFFRAFLRLGATGGSDSGRSSREIGWAFPQEQIYYSAGQPQLLVRFGRTVVSEVVQLLLSLQGRFVFVAATEVSEVFAAWDLAQSPFVWDLVHCTQLQGQTAIE